MPAIADKSERDEIDQPGQAVDVEPVVGIARGDRERIVAVVGLIGRVGEVPLGIDRYLAMRGLASKICRWGPKMGVVRELLAFTPFDSL